MRSKPLRRFLHLRWECKNCKITAKKTELITRFLANDCSTNGLKSMIGMYGSLELRP